MLPKKLLMMPRVIPDVGMINPVNPLGILFNTHLFLQVIVSGQSE